MRKATALLSRVPFLYVYPTDVTSILTSQVAYSGSLIYLPTVVDQFPSARVGSRRSGLR